MGWYIWFYMQTTQLLLSLQKNVNILNNKINLVISHIHRWFQTNQLILNLKKKKHVMELMTPKAMDYPLHIIYNDQTLKCSDNVKVLVCAWIIIWDGKNTLMM
jgi:hypothetical protein